MLTLENLEGWWTWVPAGRDSEKGEEFVLLVTQDPSGISSDKHVWRKSTPYPTSVMEQTASMLLIPVDLKCTYFSAETPNIIFTNHLELTFLFSLILLFQYFPYPSLRFISRSLIWIPKLVFSISLFYAY